MTEPLEWLASLPILMQYHSGGESVVLGIAQSWDNRYGLLDFKQSINQSIKPPPPPPPGISVPVFITNVEQDVKLI